MDSWKDVRMPAREVLSNASLAVRDAAETVRKGGTDAMDDFCRR